MFLHQLDLSGVLRLDDVLDNCEFGFDERRSKDATDRYIAGIAVERIDNWPLM